MRIIPSGSLNPLDWVQRIYESTKDPRVIHWICQMAGGFFVGNPGARTAGTEEDFLKNTQSLIREFSEALQTLSESFSNDRTVSEKEARAIRKEWEDVKRVGEGLVSACEAGLFRGE